MRRRPGERRLRVAGSLVFLVGHPLSHSLSPSMHNAVIARLGLPIRYVGFDLPPGSLADFFRIARSGEFLGGNVTIPFKEEAASLSDGATDAVRACGSANLIRVRSGRLHADNTDGRGLLAAMESQGWGKRFSRVVLLGAGGSARGIGYELARSGTREMVILNRTPARAEALADLLSGKFPSLSAAAGTLAPRAMERAFAGSDLVVQCTSLGLTAEWSSFPIGALKKGTRVVDIVYRKGGTSLVRAVRQRGILAMDGLPMLAHQAALSFGAWTGFDVPGEEFLFLAERTLDRGKSFEKGERA